MQPLDGVTRRDRYHQVRRANPHLFVSGPDAAVTILLDDEDVAAAEAAEAERLAARALPRQWAQTGVVYEDQYMLLLRDAVRFPDGRLGTYIREVHTGNAAGVVVMPVLAGEVVLVRHFRHATRSWHLEFPRGFGTPGSHPDDDARTELREEIGAVPTRLVDLGPVYADSGFSGTPVKLYFAEITTFAGPEAAEGITAVELVSPDRLAALIRDGEITDGFTINAYTRALLRGLVPAPTIGS